MVAPNGVGALPDMGGYDEPDVSVFFVSFGAPNGVGAFVASGG